MQPAAKLAQRSLPVPAPQRNRRGVVANIGNNAGIVAQSKMTRSNAMVAALGG
jgi:hypothetical protein